MLLFSAAEDNELEKLRAVHAGCRLVENAPLARSYDDVVETLPRLMIIFLDMRKRAQGHLGPLCLTNEEVEEIIKSSGLTRAQIMTKLLELGASLALTLDPADATAAVVETLRGGLYVGTAIAWRSAGVKFSVHAIQAAVLNAWQHEDTYINNFMLEAPPCGCCRQFMQEIWTFGKIKAQVVSRGSNKPVKDYEGTIVPPEQIKLTNLQGRFLGEPKRAIDLEKYHPSDPIYIAGDGAAYSYAPYSRNHAGAAVRTKHGTIHQGRYVETCSSLAGISAVEAAFVNLILSGRALADVTEIILLETRGTVTQFSSTHKLAKAMNDTPFRYIMLN